MFLIWVWIRGTNLSKCRDGATPVQIDNKLIAKWVSDYVPCCSLINKLPYFLKVMERNFKCMGSKRKKNSEKLKQKQNLNKWINIQKHFEPRQGALEKSESRNDRTNPVCESKSIIMWVKGSYIIINTMAVSGLVVQETREQVIDKIFPKYYSLRTKTPNH